MKPKISTQGISGTTMFISRLPPLSADTRAPLALSRTHWLNFQSALMFGGRLTRK
jgi:hypothetical protein